MIIIVFNDPGTFLGPGGRLPATRPAESTLPYYDVDGDDFTAAIDVVQVINFINAQSGGEGELAPNLFSAPALSPVPFVPSPTSTREFAALPPPASATSIATIAASPRNFADDSESSPLDRAARRTRELEAVLTDIATDVVRGRLTRHPTTHRSLC